MSENTRTPWEQLIKMERINQEEYIWAEKYRPQIIDDIILPSALLKKFKQWIKEENIPNLAFFGSNPGTGKTSTALAIIKEMNADSLFINSSKESGIDLIRNKLHGYSSTVSLDGGIKVAILDESDGLSGEAQKSIRGFIESVSQHTRFIFTGNFLDKILEPILNRLTVINFDTLFNENKSELAKKMMDRLEFVLQTEQVDYSREDLKPLIVNMYPSVREMLVVLQQSVVDGKLVVDTSALEVHSDYSELIKELKNKNFINARKLVAKLYSHTGFYTWAFNNIDKLVEESSMQQFILALDHYYMQTSKARNLELNLAAFCAAVMRNDITFK